MTNGAPYQLSFSVGNFLGVSGPLPLQGTNRTDSSPGKHTVQFMGHPVAELENIYVHVVEYSQNLKTYDHVTVELDVTSLGYTTDPPQLPDYWPPSPYPHFPPNLHVEFRNLGQDVVETVWFFLRVPCGAPQHCVLTRTVSPPARTGWIHDWGGTTVGMQGNFYACS
jgi:hypothetical protein